MLNILINQSTELSLRRLLTVIQGSESRRQNDFLALRTVCFSSFCHVRFLSPQCIIQPENLRDVEGVGCTLGVVWVCGGGGGGGLCGREREVWGGKGGRQSV